MPRRSLPHLPRGVAAGPQALEQVLLAQRVHRLPEPVVQIGRELALGGEALERIVLPDGGVTRDVGEDARLEHEEAAVDAAAVARGFLEKARDALVLHLQRAEA